MKFDKAIQYLEDRMDILPLKASELIRGAEAHGISARTLYRAKKVLGITAQKQRGGAWYWYNKSDNLAKTMASSENKKEKQVDKVAKQKEFELLVKAIIRTTGMTYDEAVKAAKERV